MGTLNGLLQRAESEIGYIEKASNSNLDSKTGNKGTANYTKYARDINNLGLAGCQGQPWCITFQFWLEVQEFGLEKALEHWHMTKSTYVGYNCFSTYNKFPASKRSMAPKLGAVVIFTQSHAGRVVEINGNTFTTIEGNTSPAAYDRNGGMVAKKSYSVNDSKIKGFLIIDYSNSTSSSTDTSSTTILKKGSSGASVKTLQQNLIKLGFSCGSSGADGQFGNDTESAVKAFQKKYGLTQDGIVGTKTQAKINELIKELNTSNQAFKSLYVGTGVNGLIVTASALNKRTTPVTGTVKGSVKKGTKLYPTERTSGTFNDYWFKVDGYWLSGKYLHGWVLDKTDNKWWYIDNGDYYKTGWKQIDGSWFYFMSDGYIATDKYIISADKSIYYYVDSNGYWVTAKDSKNPPISKIVK